ncbi:MAG: PAS domain S-box protein [Anaerolineales bacterium]|nr:PAS domain S-box protein [Anaerolineales bacterium]
MDAFSWTGRKISRRVLVVDSDGWLRNSIVNKLVMEGIDAVGVPNGAAAIAHVQADPDLALLLNQKLPDMTGLDLIRTLTAQGFTVPFIVMHDPGDMRLAVDVIKLGAADYLIKDEVLIDLLPCSFNRLFHTVETERKLLAAEDALKETQADLDAMLNAVNEAAFLMEPDGAILASNKITAERLAPSAADLIGWNIYDILPPETSEKRRAFAGQAIKTGKPVHFRDERDNTWVDNTIYPVKDEAGRVTRLAIFGRDVTDIKQAEKALRESRDLLAAIQQLVKIGGWEWNVEQQTMTWTDEAYRIHGFQPGEIAAGSPEHIQRSLACYDPEDRSVIEAAFYRCVEHGEPYNLEFPLTRVDGRRIWIQTMARPMMEGGRVVKVIGDIIDITEQKRAEGQLRLQSLVLDQIADRVTVTDLQGIITYVNDAEIETLGYSREELIGASTQKYGEDPERGATQQQILEETLKNGFWRGEVVNQTVDGRDIILDCRTQIVFDDRGNKIALCGISTEITERKKMEEELRRERDLNQRYLDTTQTLLVALDAKGRITMINRAGRELLGYAEEEILGYNWFETCLPKPENMENVYPVSHRIMAADLAPFEYSENIIVCKDGTQRLMGWHNTFLKDKDGRVVGTLRSGMDITEHKRAEDALRESEQKYRALVEGMPDIVMRFDRAARHLFISDNVQDVVGIPAAAFIGKTHRDLGFSESMCLFWEESIWKVYDSGAPFETEFVLEDNRSKPIVFDWRLVPEFDNHGRVQFVLSICRDITAQRKLEKDYQTLFREMLDGFALHEIICDAQGQPVDYRFLVVNPAFEKMTGLKAKAIVDKTVFEILPETEQYWIDTYGRVAQTGEPVTFENFSQALGKTFLVTAFSPAPGQFASIFTDITERKRAEDALRESEEKFRSMAEQTTDLIALTDANGFVTYASSAAELLFLYAPEEMCGRHFSEFLKESANSEAMAAFYRALTSGIRVENLELAMKRKDGSIFFGELNGSIFRSAAEDGTLVVIRDVTARKQAEQVQEILMTGLREKARQIEQVLATVPAGVLLLDTERRVLQANTLAYDYLVVLAANDIGGSLTRLGDRLLPELLTSPPTPGLWHEVKVNGRIFEVIARPVEDGPKSEQWVLVIKDVTGERHIQEQLQQQAQLAAVGQLAAGIAHDFNNIMAVIVLYTQLGLKNPEIFPKHRERLNIVLQQANRASDLIQQILDFSRRAVLERHPLDLAPFLKEVVKLLERTVPESVELILNYGMDDYMVDADPTRIQQAVMNLAINARDAMLSHGGGVLRIALSRTVMTDEIQCVSCGRVSEGDWVRITITDTGNGIPLHVLPHIFEPFFTTKEVGKGTGLGLAQVYGIVKQHDGHIDVTSKAGEGTTFTIYLPALLAHPPEVLEAERQVLVQGHGETILLVEDNVTLRNALSDILKSLNYRVLKVANGREALELLESRAGEIALVLSDLVMPEMGGQALFHAIKERGLTVPVVVLSGHPMESELAGLMSKGLAGWMLKPPNQEQLAELLARVLSDKI